MQKHRESSVSECSSHAALDAAGRLAPDAVMFPFKPWETVPGYRRAFAESIRTSGLFSGVSCPIPRSAHVSLLQMCWHVRLRWKMGLPPRRCDGYFTELAG